MKKGNKIHWEKSIAVTVFMIVLIISISYGVVQWINHREEESSFDRLHEEAGKIASHIEENAESDRENRSFCNQDVKFYGLCLYRCQRFA